MFENIDKQSLADMLKAKLLKPGMGSGERNSAVNILQGFERLNWYPQMFQRAVDEFGGLELNETGIQIDGDPTGVINLILTRYEELVHQEMVERIFGTNEAMQYISDKLTRAGHEISIWGVKKYINRGDIQGQLVGKSLVFKQSTLDKFIADYLASPPKTGPKGPRQQKETAF